MLDYENKEGGPSKDSLALRQRLTRYQQDPYRLSIDKVSPNFIAEQADLSNLLIRARTQLVNGDLDGALETYREIELRYPNSPEAKHYQSLIARQLMEISRMDRQRTSELMLSAISAGWAMPQGYLPRARIWRGTRPGRESHCSEIGVHHHTQDNTF